MPLVVQNRRDLSPLERDAINLAFDGAVNPDDLTVEVSNQIIFDLGGGVTDAAHGAHHGNGEIEISRVQHANAENLHLFSTVDTVDLTVPNNIKYLATLVHESAHHWQSVNQRYTNRVPIYNFNAETLQLADFECKEQHASTAQVYFVVAWQLHHGIDPVDLTDNRFLPRMVGPTNRMARIKEIPHIQGRRLVAVALAESIRDDFNNFLVDLN